MIDNVQIGVVRVEFFSVLLGLIFELLVGVGDGKEHTIADCNAKPHDLDVEREGGGELARCALGHGHNLNTDRVESEPGEGAETVAVLVRGVLIPLFENSESAETPHGYSVLEQVVLGRNPEGSLKEKVVAVDDEKHNDGGSDSHKLLNICETSPFVFLKHCRSQLLDKGDHLVLARDTSCLLCLLGLLLAIKDPGCLLGAVILQGVVAEDDSDQVAPEEVQEEVIPPALVKVGQPVAESELADLKADRADPGQVPVAHETHLAPPAKEVGNEVYVENSIADVRHERGRVFGCEDTAVVAVAALWKRLSKIVIKYSERLSSDVDWEEQKVSHEKGVEDHDSHERSPENRMRSRHDRVRQMNRAYTDGGEANTHIGSIYFEILN